MTILFASNNVDDYAPPMAIDTSVANYDTTRVDYGMKLFDGGANQQHTPHVESSTTVTWYHCRMNWTARSSGETGSAFTFKDANGDTLAVVEQNILTFAAQVYGDTTEVGAYVTVANGIHLMDMKLTVTPSDITMELYADKVLISTATAVNTVGGKGKPVSFNPEVNASIYSGATHHTISEIIASETDTRDMRLVKRNPNGAGFHSDFIGGFAALGDEDETTLALGATNGDRVSSSIVAYSSASTVVAVVLSARGAQSGAAPANLRQGFRIASTDYDGVQVALGANLQNVIDAFEVDPSTGVAWTDTGISAAEIMLKAET